MLVMLALVGAVLVYFRFAGYKSQAYQAIAHLFVGGLFGAFFVGWDYWMLAIALAMSVAEVIAFLRSRSTKLATS
jgi:ABC-type Mn2+/Zn2+ transport system permease subunit